VTNKTVAIYDNEAANYDKSRFSDSFGVHLDFTHKKILEGFIGSVGNSLLEIGIGTGRFGTWLAKKGFKVIGMDISKEMLKKTKVKANLLKTDVSLVLGDVHHLPFKKGTFDNCICINVMDHFQNYEEFFRQVRSVLKVDGSLVFNFANSQSPYLPVAALVNLSKHALFKTKIFSRWLTFKEINVSLSEGGLEVAGVRGCMIASPVPLGERLLNVVRSVNLLSEQSNLRFFSGSIFVKARRSSR
jgi:ubiquinone/menaquinone biosynthesis C-methylase UbiE